MSEDGRTIRRGPLKGKKILVTRPKTDGSDLVRRLKELGGTCVHLPAIRIRPKVFLREEAEPILEKLPRYDWVLFTSRYGVENLDRLARRWGRSLSVLVKGKICAIGPRTARSVSAVGLQSDLLPEFFSTEGIRRAFRRIPLKGQRILIPRSDLGVLDRMALELRKAGAAVDEVILYETIPARFSAGQLEEALKGVDVATFTSASTVRSFFGALRRTSPGLGNKRALNGTAIVAIGPETAKALKAEGLRPHLPNGTWTIEGLIQAVVEAAGG